MKYRSFFSYSRADDRAADWLHAQLDRYRTPRALVGSQGALGPVPAKLHPIFRDRTDLESGGHVDAVLQRALEASDTLTVLCTPTSAKSPWVNHECETFLRLGREARIFPVIASGEPESGDPATECFPPALRGKGLLAADLREIRRPNGQLVGDGRDGGRLKLIAGLLGLPLDALVRRERRRQRQILAGLAGATVVFAALAIVAAITATLASHRLEISQRAESRELVERVEDRLGAGDPLGAMNFALSALPNASDRPLLPEATSALQAAKVEDRLRLVRRRDGAEVRGLAWLPQGALLGVLWSDAVLEHIDVATGLVSAQATLAAPPCKSAPLILGLAPSAGHVLGVCPAEDGDPAADQGATLLLWDAARPGQPRALHAPPAFASPLPRGDRLSVSFAGSRALVYGRSLDGLDIAPLLVDFGPAPFARGIGAGPASRALLLAQGDLAATLSEQEGGRGVACVWVAATGARRGCRPANEEVLAIAAEPAGRRVALIDSTRLAWWNVDDQRVEEALGGNHTDLDPGQLLIAQGALFGVKQRERAEVVARPLDGQRTPALSLPTSATALEALTLSADGRLAAAAANGSAVALWALQPPASRRIELPDGRADVISVEVENGKVTAVFRSGGVLRPWPDGASHRFAVVDDDSNAVIHTPVGQRRIVTDMPRRFVEAVRAALALRQAAASQAAASQADPPTAPQIRVPQLRRAELSRDGTHVLLVADRSGVCEVWRVADARLVYSSLAEAASAWRGNSVSQGTIYWGCTLNADGSRIARSGNVGVELRDTNNGRVLWSDQRDMRLAFSADGHRLGAFAMGRGAVLIYAESGKVLASNADLPALQMHGLGGAGAESGVEIANGRLRLVRIADGMELARAASSYFPAAYGPWSSADGRWFVTWTRKGLELSDLRARSIEGQIDEARTRAFPAGALGRSHVISGDSRFIPRADDRSGPRCESLLIDPFDPARAGAAQIFPAADGATRVGGREQGCARPAGRPRGAAEAYAWALGYLASESDRGPLDGELGSLAASVINPPTRDFDQEVAAALEEAGRGGRPVALLRRAQLLAGKSYDPRRWSDAIALARQAEAQGVAAAAWWLSEVHRVRGETQEMHLWLARAEARRFPHAFARLAEAAEREAQQHREDAAQAKACALRAIGYWTRAIEAARSAGWPEDYAEYPRVRLATLSRSPRVDGAEVAAAWRRGVEEEAARRRWPWLGKWRWPWSWP